MPQSPSLLYIVTDVRQAALKEKRQKRRESHNAVERRRRDNINEKIQELAAIIPDEFMTPSSAIHGASSPLSGSPATHHAPDGTVKHNKGIILRKSVDYIRSLQDVVKESQRRARRLEEEVKRLGGDPKSVDQDESRRESMTNLEEEEGWLDDAFLNDDSPGMMMD
jgi:Helix-loop-helix DNA-binding domain